MSFPFAAVLFDLDGVVVDTMPLHRQVWGDFARLHNLRLSEERLRAYDGRRAADIIRDLFGADLPDNTVGRLASERETLYARRLSLAELHPVEGVTSYLAALKRHGVPCALATSAIPSNVEIMLKRVRLSQAFDAILSAADVSQGKPNPEIYLKAAARLGQAPESCLVIEDALPGVEAGHAAGCQVLGLTASGAAEEPLRTAGAAYVAPHFDALPSALRL